MILKIWKSIASFLLAMSTVLGLSSVLAQTTVTNYPVTNDTFVRSSAANNSFGYSPNVIVGGWGDMTIGMVKPANFASLPVLATGDKAELWLYNTVSGYSPTQIQVGLAGLPWSEYNTWNSGLSWYPTSVVTANISAPGYWTAIDVTASYNMAKSGQALYYGWYLVPINTNGQFNFFASAEHSNTAWRPFVRVTKVSQVVVDPYRFLSFPLKVTGFTDWKTAPITSVMDHSKTSTLLSNQNGVVMTWSGLTASKLSNATTDTTCRGFDTVDTITSISHLNGVNVPYVGASSCGKGKTLSYDGHTGIDYAAPNGTPVYAAADGVVTETECDGSVGVGDISGNCGGVGRIIIKHTINVGGVQKNIYTWSLHLSKGLYQDNKTVVKKGDRVTSGQQIGLSGATGAGTAYHLHFEVRVGCGAESVRASATVANCSSRPSADTMGASVDPFGWTGPGSDPLASSNGFQYWYQAEGFVPRLLWK